MEDYYGNPTEIKESLYQTEVNGNEVIITIDNIRKFIADANYHIYVEFEAKLNNEAADINEIEAILSYNDKEGNNQEVGFNKVTVLKP